MCDTPILTDEHPGFFGASNSIGGAREAVTHDAAEARAEALPAADWLNGAVINAHLDRFAKEMGWTD